jgi:hypothetical protein
MVIAEGGNCNIFSQIKAVFRDEKGDCKLAGQLTEMAFPSFFFVYEGGKSIIVFGPRRVNIAGGWSGLASKGGGPDKIKSRPTVGSMTKS